MNQIQSDTAKYRLKWISMFDIYWYT